MIAWTFTINDVEVDEPQGMDDLVLKITRDDQWHGIFFEASTSLLQFFGAGAVLLTAEKDANGLGASATFRAIAECGDSVDIIEGNFDFGTYSENCGNACGVQIAIEKTGCIMTMRNRYDQKVDLDKTTSFNNTTLLQDYTGLNINIELPAQVLRVGAEAEMDTTPVSEIISNSPEWIADAFGDFVGYIAPAFPVVTNDSLGVLNTSPIIELSCNQCGANNRAPYPDFAVSVGTSELIADIKCDLTSVQAEFRLKGNANVVYSGTPDLVVMRVKLFRLPDGLDGTVAGNWVEEYTNTFYNLSGTNSVNFDVAATVPLTITQGDFIYFGIFLIANDISDIGSFTLTQDVECFFALTAAEACEATTADVYMINEAGSRIVESITDGCLTMKSDYYGRTDSQPYTSTEDGCGSLRVISNGLKIRKAANSNHFISLQEFFKGIRGIDNIGMGIEPNTVLPGDKEWLRIEPVEYFYQDVEILRCTFIPSSKSSLDPLKGYSIIKIGYEKWEVTKINGLDEFNSNKEFRTGISTINNTLDAVSNFVAGGYPIEVTRQQSFAKTGAADTKYDNETFIICVERGGYDYIVEQGNIDNSANIFSPTTAYNWRIRPLYNLMRWAKSIYQTYVALVNTTSKLFFTSGTGNYTAEGELPAADPCKLESAVLAENHDLYKADFASDDYVPIYQPETIQFTYPLSIADYLAIKANPYGYILVQCGTGEYEKAFIKSIDFKLTKGEATFNLIKKWL